MGVTAVAGLMAHQREGVEFLLGKGSGLLAFEQGLGKTLVAIEAYQRLRADNQADALLVVCPSRRAELAELSTVQLGGLARSLDPDLSLDFANRVRHRAAGMRSIG